MLMTKMRQHMKIMLWILVLAFIGTIIFSWGMDYTGGGGSKAQKGIIGTINGTDVPREYFMNLLQEQYTNYRQQYGQEPDHQDLVDYAADHNINDGILLGDQGHQLFNSFSGAGVPNFSLVAWDGEILVQDDKDEVAVRLSDAAPAYGGP